MASEGAAVQDDGDGRGGGAWSAGGVVAGVVPLGPFLNTLLSLPSSLFG